MKILFYRLWSDADEVIPPVGVGYLMQQVRSMAQTHLLDGLKDRLGPTDLARETVQGGYDLVGIGGFSKDGKAVKEHLAAVRKASPKTKILVGGVLVTASPERTYEYLKGHADYFLAGEAEQSFPKLIEALQNGADPPEIPGLARPTADGLYWPKFQRPENLDDLQVAWDMLKPETYPPAPHGAFSSQFPCAPIITSRGCPVWCVFCSVPALTGKKLRRRSVPNVIEEIRLLHERHGVNEIHIEDDNFTCDEQYVLNFTDELRKLPYRITWTCPNGVRLDTLTDPVLEAMKQSGCTFLSVGVESADDSTLSEMHKGFDTAKVRSKLEQVARHGIRTGGFFIIGLPGDTAESIEKTAGFARSLPLTRASFSYYQPFPGSPLRGLLEKRGRLGPVDFEKESLELHKVGFTPESMTPGQLATLRRKAFLRFYLRPRPLWGLLTSISSVAHLRYVAARVKRWLS